MRRIGVLVSLSVAALVAVTGCSSSGGGGSSSGSSSSGSATRAVVVVSGGGAVSPFTTPTEACTSGLAAGNTDTALREYLLGQGKQVFTAPANMVPGVVTEPDPSSFGAFGDCPPALPANMTITSTEDIDLSGERLTRFLGYLNETYGISEVDLVGHSNGGLYSRAAIRDLKDSGSPITVTSLTTLGTPHQGNVPSRYATGEITLAEACQGDAACEDFDRKWKKYARGAAVSMENTQSYLDGPQGWNARQKGVLDGIPVTLLAGSYFMNEKGAAEDPDIWPFDGIVSKYSGLAEGLPDSVIPHRTCWSAPLTHSIFVSDVAKLDWQTALTWNTDSLARVNAAIDGSATALEQPNRQGCPAAP